MLLRAGIYTHVDLVRQCTQLVIGPCSRDNVACTCVSVSYSASDTQVPHNLCNTCHLIISYVHNAFIKLYMYISTLGEQIQTESGINVHVCTVSVCEAHLRGKDASSNEREHCSSTQLYITHLKEGGREGGREGREGRREGMREELGV